jgi:hypothetical protein
MLMSKLTDRVAEPLAYMNMLCGTFADDMKQLGADLKVLCGSDRSSKYLIADAIEKIADRLLEGRGVLKKAGLYFEDSEEQ